MSATAEELPGADVDSNDRMRRNRPVRAEIQLGIVRPKTLWEAETCPTPTQRLRRQGRYTFGSGARPLDGYTIKRAIGRGGFGEVYYATSDSGKEVALKLILRNLDVERRGVLQCMNLKCPNLLTIFDLKASDADDTFVVMEYVAGPSLASVLKQYPSGLPLPEVRRWLKGLVEGVAYLHDHGIVHRDLKPANLFMEEGIVKIGDYGLAKLITPSHGTEHSESIGTCHYMAPEIGSGKYNKPIDVYAMGVILYEMITGRVPFDGETVNEVLMKHLTARPDVSSSPSRIRTIVAKALAKDPNQRPSSRLRPASSRGRAPPPEVRIIGDGKAGQRRGRQHADDDVHAYRGRGADLLHRAGYSSTPRSEPGGYQGAAAGQLGRTAAARAVTRPSRPRPRGPSRSWLKVSPGPTVPLVAASPTLRRPPKRRLSGLSPRRPRSRPVYLAAASASPSWPDRCSGLRPYSHCSLCQPLRSWGSILPRTPSNSHTCSAWRCWAPGLL